MAVMNMSLEVNTWPGDCRIDSNSSSDSTLERSSGDLQTETAVRREMGFSETEALTDLHRRRSAVTGAEARREPVDEH